MSNKQISALQSLLNELADSDRREVLRQEAENASFPRRLLTAVENTTARVRAALKDTK